MQKRLKIRTTNQPFLLANATYGNRGGKRGGNRGGGIKGSKSKNKVPCLVKKWEGKRVHSLNLVISPRRSVQS